jgi:hypothetical protein
VEACAQRARDCPAMPTSPRPWTGAGQPERDPAAGGCGFASLPPDRTPGRHFTRVFCINGGSDEGIQINSGGHTQEIKIIGAGKIYNIFPLLVKYLVIFEIDTMCG